MRPDPRGSAVIAVAVRRCGRWGRPEFFLSVVFNGDGADPDVAPGGCEFTLTQPRASRGCRASLLATTSSSPPDTSSARRCSACRSRLEIRMFIRPSFVKAALAALESRSFRSSVRSDTNSHPPHGRRAIRALLDRVLRLSCQSPRKCFVAFRLGMMASRKFETRRLRASHQTGSQAAARSSGMREGRSCPSGTLRHTALRFHHPLR